MTKKLLITVVVLVLLYPALVWVLGGVIESRSSVALAELNEKAPYITVTENKYHRGWYTSEQDLTVTLFASQMAGLAPLAGANSAWLSKGVPVTFHTVIHHGPFCGWSCFALARADTHMVLSNEAKAAVTLIYGSAEPVSITSRLGFFGGGTSTFTSPALTQVAVPGGGKLSWDGFKIIAHYTRHNDSFKVEGTAPHLLVDGPDGKRFEIKAVALKAASTRALRSVYAGDFEFTIDSISYAGVGGSAPVLVSDFKYAGKSSVDSGLYSLALQFDTGAIGSNALKIKDAHFDLTFKHIDLVGMADLTDKMRDLYKDPSATDPIQHSQAMLAVLKQQGGALLLKQPQLSLDRVGVETASGQVLLTGTLSIPGVTAEDLANASGATALMQKLVADFEVSLDDSALSELPGAASLQPQLETMAQQGFFTHDGGRWHTTIHSAQGQSTFNGKPFQPGAMAPAAPAPSPAPPARR